jgi:long-chain acyl-CoA synthetase
VLSVPRLYEKIYARVLQNAVSSGALSEGFSSGPGALPTGGRTSARERASQAGRYSKQYGLAQKLVFSKIKERTGGRMRYFVSGGAPLAPKINKFFYSVGLTILEGYGLTETSP